ncbi:MAG: mechanosensitive ion channel [Bernardetiaceae bacterium]|nr:mechanosensitive ion channel [Bernardetiaceae bacterium]
MEDEETTDLIIKTLSSPDKIWALITSHAFPVLYALIAFIVGWFIVGVVQKGIKKAIDKSISDASLSNFLVSLIGVVLKILLFLTVIGILGVQTTSFAAILGAASLAVGLSLQGSLANFAGGVLILALRPFKVGEFIEAKSFMGTVAEIQIFYTILKTVDNKTVIIPNGELSNAPLTNFSREDKRRADVMIGIGYNSDIRKAKSIIMDIYAKDERVLRIPDAPADPQILVADLADSSIDLSCRAWVRPADFFVFMSDFREEVKYRFDAEGVEIPFPQRVVHLQKGGE